ncbi:hypothetical protein [Ruegeria sp.]|uniref:hypothetical protein n=1 Tax=Ruegeria sp. TaxID=1879320 RepID=UPI003C7AF223
MASAVEGKAIKITEGNVKNNHIPIAHVADLFPADCFGGSRKAAAAAPIDVMLDGIGTFETDIAEDKKILRIRANGAVGEFYKRSHAKEGTRIFFEKIGPRLFRITAFN